MIKKISLILVITLLVLVSLFPRSIESLNGNPLFEIDQGRDYLEVKKIVVDHKLTLIGAELGAGQAGLQYLFHGPGYFYMMTIPYVLFNGNPVGGVYFMLLFGLSAIAFGIFLATRLFGWKEGLLMGFLIALCPFFIGQSRSFVNHFPTPVLILIIFYFVYLLTKKPSRKLLFFSAFLSSFLYNFETAIAIPVSLSLLLYCIFIFKKKSIQKLPFLFLGFIGGILPMIAFEVKHGFLGIRGALSYLFTTHPVHESSPTIFIHTQNIFNLFVYSFFDSFPKNLLFPIFIVLPLFLVLLIFVYRKEKDKTIKNFFGFILLLYPVNFAIFLLLRNIIFSHYIIDLYLANILLFVYIISRVYLYRYKKLAYGISFYIGLLILLGSWNALQVSAYDYHDYGGVHKLQGKTEAIDFIFQDAKRKPFGIFVFAPPVYTYPYDYLIWWIGTKKYSYVPPQEKLKTFYLLIEQDPQKPWTYKGWKETVIKTGNVIFTKEMPRSGLIVEKREAN